jgi:hypothetical protein
MRIEGDSLRNGVMYSDPEIESFGYEYKRINHNTHVLSL